MHIYIYISTNIIVIKKLHALRVTGTRVLIILDSSMSKTNLTYFQFKRNRPYNINSLNNVI